MDSEFYRPVYLAHLFDWTEPIRGRINLLFVKLDSNPDLSAVENHLSTQLKQADISFSSKAEGLWIPGSELANSFVSDKIAVPFSACYIFDSRTTSCVKPSFNTTTDTERPFSDSQVRTVSGEITNLNALGYAADGCGLQWVSSDDELSRLIRQGYASWRECERRLKSAGVGRSKSAGPTGG